MRVNLVRVEWWRVFRPEFALTPVTVSWSRHQCAGLSSMQYVQWSELYVFGFRVARWRYEP